MVPVQGTPHSDLEAFLKDIKGVDFSAHRELFLAQGFNMRILRTLAQGSDAVLHRVVDGLLRHGASDLNGRQGLSPLEVLLLTDALVEQANEP